MSVCLYLRERPLTTPAWPPRFAGAMLSKLRTLRGAVALPARHLARLPMLPLALQRHLSYGSAIGLKRLRMLEEDANRHPSDASKQLALMTACNKAQQGSVAVRRFESGNFGSDDAVMREYIKALAQSGQLSRLSLNQLAGGQNSELAMAQRIAGAPHGMDGFQQRGTRGTTDEPLHVQWHESPRAQMYATRGSNPGPAEPRQACYSHVWPSPWTGGRCLGCSLSPA